MVAHNSHCLHQWHPDLVENVTPLDARLSPTCALNRSRNQQPVRHRSSHSTRTVADNSGSSPSTYTLEHGVTCQPRLASWPLQGQQEDSKLCCTGGDGEEMAKSEAGRVSQAAAQPSSASYVLRMVSKLAEFCSAQPSTMPVVCPVPCDRTPTIRLTTSGPRKLNTPSPSSSQRSDVHRLSPTGVDTTTTTLQQDIQPDSRHLLKSDSSAHRSASLCRSARRIKTVQSQSGITRSQSDRQTSIVNCRGFNLPCRFRPDNSWILRESKVCDTPIEAGGSALSEPCHHLRPHSALPTTTTIAFGVRHTEERSENLPHRVHSLAFGHKYAIPQPLVGVNTYCPVDSNTSDPIDSVNTLPTTAYSADCTAGSQYSLSA